MGCSCPSASAKTMEDSTMPFSTRRPNDRISVTSLRPLACRAQWTTRSMQEATVGTTKALALQVKTPRFLVWEKLLKLVGAKRRLVLLGHHEGDGDTGSRELHHIWDLVIPSLNECHAGPLCYLRVHGLG